MVCIGRVGELEKAPNGSARDYMGSLLIGLSTKDCIFKAPVSVVSGLSRSRGRAQHPEFLLFM